VYRAAVTPRSRTDEYYNTVTAGKIRVPASGVTMLPWQKLNLAAWRVAPVNQATSGRPTVSIDAMARLS
jgi:hypothetical protein